MPAPSSACGAPARKALYLATSEALRIGTEGEALVLRRSSMAASRHPFARIERIVCNHNAHWSGEALAGCLRHGIPVTWVDGHGRFLGSIVSPVKDSAPTGILLERYLDCPDWRSRYENWLRRRRMDILVLAALRAQHAGHPFPQARFDEIKRDYVYNAHLDPLLPPLIYAACVAYVVGQLRQAGLAASHWGFDAQVLALADDFAGFLWAELNLESASLVAATTEPRTHILFLENWLAAHPTRLGDPLARFRRHLAQVSSPWP